MAELNPDISPLVDGLTSDPKTWSNSSLISVTQITPSGLSLLYNKTLEMRNIVKNKGGGDNRLKHCILSSVFYEASTRTSCSFQTAMLRLGGTFIHVDAGSGGNTSASKKGETLLDTIRCLQCYTDVTVLRHNVKGNVGDIVIKDVLEKPVINAGDGVGEHPTQALLDLFTIVDELDMLSDNNDGDNTQPLVVVLLGDLKHGRTVHSLAKLLARTQEGFIKRKLILRYCSPPSLQMPQYVKDYVDQFAQREGCDIVQEEFETVTDSALDNANVLYVTRVQKERFDTVEEYNKVKGVYVVDKDFMRKAPSKMIVMHPLPRVDEISTDVDSDPRAAYFREMENGLYVRMAILDLVLGGGQGGE
jgi:aspartate carbamoyltransferase catalytic subunit